MELKSGAHIHMMGICGTAMASLAGLLKDRGYKITGSDSHPYPPMSTQIENMGIQVMNGYKPEHLHPKPDFVIVGNVISASNPEAQELVRLEIPYTSLPKAMGEFILSRHDSVVISGTHGKTTTTSMMSWALESLNEKPGFLIGGIPKNFAQSFRNPVGKFFVIEGDEYDTAYFDKVPKFIHYRPKHVVLTSVEFDHADIYKDLDAVKDAFRRLLELIPLDGNFIYHAKDENIQSILGSLKPGVPTYSYGVGCGDVQIEILAVTEKGTEFNLKHKNSNQKFFIPLTGEYNILNAAAVYTLLCVALKKDVELVRQSFLTFQGVKRRQEILGEPNGILVIEDFAHHPTAVKETIRGIRKRYPERKLFSVFEPRSATSRRKVFQKDYVLAFEEAQDVLIAQAFDQSKIDQELRFDVSELVDDLNKSSVRQNFQAGVFVNADTIVSDLKKRTQRGDVVLIMSNGGFDGIYEKLMKALQG